VRPDARPQALKSRRGIRGNMLRIFRAENDADGRGSSAVVERSESDMLLGIPCQLCYKPAEGLSGSLEGRSHDNGAAVNIPRAIDLGGNLLQSGRDRLPLPHHTESRSDEL
jgi:hypothetical protein